MSAVVDRSADQVLASVLDDATGPVFVVGPSRPVLRELVDVAIDGSDPPTLRVLADDDTLKDTLDDFLVASNAADLVEDGTLSLRVAENGPGNELLLTGTELTALVTAGEAVAALATDDEGFVDLAYDHYADAWEDADEYRLRTPPLSRVRDSLREEIGPDAEADFNRVLESLDTARGEGDAGLDEVTISLLVAAKNEELLYDISKWGEDVGIASKATFSRTKTTLEDFGLLDTEKVPIDVGRPRLRLKFAHDQLEDASADQLASVARSLLG